MDVKRNIRKKEFCRKYFILQRDTYLCIELKKMEPIMLTESKTIKILLIN